MKRKTTFSMYPFPSEDIKICHCICLFSCRVSCELCMVHPTIECFFCFVIYDMAQNILQIKMLYFQNSQAAFITFFCFILSQIVFLKGSLYFNPAFLTYVNVKNSELQKGQI